LIEETLWRRAGFAAPSRGYSPSIGTIAASLELRRVSEVLTLRTFGAAVSFSTKP
jgi:hypothetical protein